MDWSTLIAEFERLWATVQNLAVELAQPWRLYQLGILAAAFLFAHLAERRLEPRLDAWMRGLRDMNKGLLRLLVLITRYLRPLIFIALGWAAVMILRATTWPSRSYVIATVASLVTAWVFVSIASRVIRNRVLRTIVTWSAWAVVTIYVLGIMTEVGDVLDRIAINIGDLRISLLIIVQAVVTLAVLIILASWSSAAVKRRIDAAQDISPSGGSSHVSTPGCAASGT